MFKENLYKLNHNNKKILNENFKKNQIYLLLERYFPLKLGSARAHRHTEEQEDFGVSRHVAAFLGGFPLPPPKMMGLGSSLLYKY